MLDFATTIQFSQGKQIPSLVLFWDSFLFLNSFSHLIMQVVALDLCQFNQKQPL